MRSHHLLTVPWGLAFAAVALVSCTCPKPETESPASGDPTAGGPAKQPPADTPVEPPSAAETRRPLVPTDHPQYARVEGDGLDNDCASDAQCFIGGCSAEICSASRDASSTCEAFDWPTAGGSCGCVAGQCVWYVTDATPDSTSPGSQPETPPEPAIGAPCADDSPECGDGLTCVEYYGVAGPRGPKFRSCEIRCKADTACPQGLRCVTIADGPGQVCRPVSPPK